MVTVLQTYMHAYMCTHTHTISPLTYPPVGHAFGLKKKKKKQAQMLFCVKILYGLMSSPCLALQGPHCKSWTWPLILNPEQQAPQHSPSDRWGRSLTPQWSSWSTQSSPWERHRGAQISTGVLVVDWAQWLSGLKETTTWTGSRPRLLFWTMQPIAFHGWHTLPRTFQHENPGLPSRVCSFLHSLAV